MSLIQLENISFGYDNEIVLNNISLEIDKGECVVLMGNNGCGKSTLLKILNGLLIPNKGKYNFDNQLIDQQYFKNHSQEKTFHQRIGYVFQNSDAQLFSTHVYEELAFAPSQMNLNDEEIHTRVNDVLKLLEIENLKERAPYQLSGGEKRKVAIGCVLTQNPEVLVLDEPIASLDKKTQDWLTDFLIQLKKSGKTMIIATHDEAFASIVGDRIITINDNHEIS